MRHTAEEALARMKKNWPKAVTPTGEVCLRVFRLSDLLRARAQRLVVPARSELDRNRRARGIAPRAAAA